MTPRRSSTPTSTIRRLLVDLVVKFGLALCLEDDPDLTSVCTDATGDALAQLLVQKRRLKPGNREPGLTGVLRTSDRTSGPASCQQATLRSPDTGASREGRARVDGSAAPPTWPPGRCFFWIKRCRGSASSPALRLMSIGYPLDIRFGDRYRGPLCPWYSLSPL
jgi:hypothetical protein